MFWAEIWKISVFLSENFQLFLEVKFSIHLNRHVLVILIVPCWIVLSCFWKRVYALKEKKLCPIFFLSEKEPTLKEGYNLVFPFRVNSSSEGRFGSKFFLFRIEPFLEGEWHAVKQARSQKSCLHLERWWKIYEMYPVPLNLLTQST